MKQNTKYLLLAFCMFISTASFAQETFTVTDTEPVTAGSLKFGYNITNETQKEVGNKGDFSRFSVQFYVTNTSSEAKILLYRTGFNLFGSDVSPTLVQFNCLNATGARLTSKEALLQAKPCNVMASVEDKDCSSNKTKQNKRLAQIGYWIKAGETISAKAIMIVPLNEKPNMRATLFSQGALIASASDVQPFDQSQPYNQQDQQYNNQQNQPYYNQPYQGQAFGSNFVKIKSFATSIYLNNQNGPLASTKIDNDWWSAQWKIIPVPGTSYYLIQNRWKGSYICGDNASLLTNDTRSNNAKWTIELSSSKNSYNIKNAASGDYLVMENGQLLTMQVPGEMDYSKWAIEQ